MSLNIHYLVPDDDRTDWEGRKSAVSAALKDLDADVVLFQEMETFQGGHAPSQNLQLEWVLETVESYSAGAVGDPDVFPVTQPILYRSSRFELVEQGFFFFSDTPDVIYSEPWSGNWPAFVTWVRLRFNDGGQEIYVFNAHLDAFSRKNRVRGVELIARRIMDRKDSLTPVVLAGDFNSFKGAGQLKPLAGASMQRVEIEGSTYHFGNGTNLYQAIDHFYISSGFSVVEAGSVQKKWEGEWPSDHHPVYAAINF